jgi:hypothetical protein
LATDVAEKQELLQRLDQFFDQAIDAAVVGYERNRKKEMHPPKAATKTRAKMQKES